MAGRSDVRKLDQVLGVRDIRNGSWLHALKALSGLCLPLRVRLVSAGKQVARHVIDSAGLYVAKFLRQRRGE